MNRGERFADALAARAGCALNDSSAQRSICAVGDLAFELIAPAGGRDWIGRAMVPAEAGLPAKTPIQHRVFAWDANCGAPPQRPWGASDHEPLGVVAAFTNDAVRSAFDIHTSSLIVYDFRNACSYTWYPSIAELPAWAKASPFRIPMSWLLNAHGLQMIHGAAVAVGGRAALLCGAGGAGKSTTALACALAGFEYLGDDYCAIDASLGRVHMIYRTAKVLPSTLAMLPTLAPMLVNRARLEQEKGVIFLDNSELPLLRSAAIEVLLLPRRNSGNKPGLSPASRADAMKAVLPSTVGGLMGGTAVTPRCILALLQNVPAFHLDLGPDLDRVTEIVGSFLTRS